MGDDATAAVSDTFELNQGQSTLLDVLDNDLDGAGNGLTIVNVSESENATIEITDDMQLLYTPEPGYFSPDGDPDTFMYTIEDSDGTQQTANVAANVVRFSDINDNLLNDFDECDCTDLTLETGVDGSGIGHMSWLFLFALLLTGFGRLSSFRQQSSNRGDA